MALNFQNQIITNARVPTPVNNADPVNKEYVDRFADSDYITAYQLSFDNETDTLSLQHTTSGGVLTTIDSVEISAFDLEQFRAAYDSETTRGDHWEAQRVNNNITLRYRDRDIVTFVALDSDETEARDQQLSLILSALDSDSEFLNRVNRQLDIVEEAVSDLDSDARVRLNRTIDNFDSDISATIAATNERIDSDVEALNERINMRIDSDLNVLNIAIARADSDRIVASARIATLDSEIDSDINAIQVRSRAILDRLEGSDSDILARLAARQVVDSDRFVSLFNSVESLENADSDIRARIDSDQAAVAILHLNDLRVDQVGSDFQVNWNAETRTMTLGEVYDVGNFVIGVSSNIADIANSNNGAWDITNPPSQLEFNVTHTNGWELSNRRITNVAGGSVAAFDSDADSDTVAIISVTGNANVVVDYSVDIHRVVGVAPFEDSETRSASAELSVPFYYPYYIGGSTDASPALTSLTKVYTPVPSAVTIPISSGQNAFIATATPLGKFEWNFLGFPIDEVATTTADGGNGIQYTIYRVGEAVSGTSYRITR